MSRFIRKIKYRNEENLAKDIVIGGLIGCSTAILGKALQSIRATRNIESLKEIE